MANFLLQENGFNLLLETGDKILLQEGSSPSASVSSSISQSTSPSPSLGYSLYSRQATASLPTTAHDLSTVYTDQEEERVAARDDSIVGQVGAGQYMIHQFKIFVQGQTFCELEFQGRSSLAPSSSPVYFQLYNPNSHTWETVDTEAGIGADIDFELEYKITSVASYIDSQGLITVRVYQLAT